MELQLVPLDLLILFALGFLGAAVLKVLLPEASWLTLSSLGLPVGGLLFSFTFYLTGSLGLPFTRPTAVSVLLLPILVFSVLAIRKITSLKKSPDLSGYLKGEKPDIRDILFYVFLFLVFLVLLVLSVSLSYHTWDAIATWALGGYGMVLRKSILGAAEFGNGFLSYPMNIQLQIALFRLVDGDILPGSKLLFPVYYLSILIGLYQFMMQWDIKKPLARASILLIAGTPIMFHHSYIGYTNLAFTAYFVLGVLWLIKGLDNNCTREAILGSILLAGGLWTRPEGLALAIVAVTISGLFLLFHRKLDLSFALVLLPIAAVYAGWKIPLINLAGVEHSAEPMNLVEAAVRELMQGELHWSAWVTIFKFIAGQILRFRDFGILAGMTLLILAFGFDVNQVKREKTIQHLWLITIFSGIAILGAHYAGIYQPEGDKFLYRWLSLEFTRVALPVVLLLYFLALAGINEGFETDFLRKGAEKVRAYFTGNTKAP